MITASRQFEKHLLRNYKCIAGVDEVGRGALAGPVYVCISVITDQTVDPQFELKDSKAVSAKKREELCEQAKNWLDAYAIGIATNVEVDSYGIVNALQLAGLRAVTQLHRKQIYPQIYLLDGNHDWLSIKDTLLEQEHIKDFLDLEPLNVITQVKADANCTLVAAASNIAKVSRDNYMMSLNDTVYDFSSNKGYSSKKHKEALAEHGLSNLHRCTWKMPV